MIQAEHEEWKKWKAHCQTHQPDIFKAIKEQPLFAMVDSFSLMLPISLQVLFSRNKSYFWRKSALMSIVPRND
jgi:hypothetical protein